MLYYVFVVIEHVYGLVFLLKHGFNGEMAVYEEINTFIAVSLDYENHTNQVAHLNHVLYTK